MGPLTTRMQKPTLCALGLLLLASACTRVEERNLPNQPDPANTTHSLEEAAVNQPKTISSDRVTHTDEEWKKLLTPEQYRVCRRHGTEAAFTGKFHDSKKKGVYVCVACGKELFCSDTKFDSGTGWPSFYQPIGKDNVGSTVDNGFFTTRTEVHCARCDSHLGHVFEDVPEPTGLRYCINSVSLDLKEKE